VKTESDPLNPDPPAGFRQTLAAQRTLEDLVTRAPGGVVLRHGAQYGPGTSLSTGGPQIKAIRKRMLPVVGGGSGVWSFIHVVDAAEATVAALARGEGIYNIVDDEPAPVREWLPQVATALGAKPPRRVPVWLARWVGGEYRVAFMTRSEGLSNEKAKRELGLELRYPSWRQGFSEGLG
jgi:nucleoside-diphosphate-sugar epimerase